MDDDPLMTTVEVAALLRTPPATVKWWRTTSPQRGPHGFRVGRRVLYRRVDVEAWLDDARRQSMATDPTARA